MGPGAGDVPGPYSARVTAPPPRQPHPQQAAAAAAAAAAASAASDAWWQAAPPALPADATDLLPDGWHKKFKDANFCWGFCANKNCTEPCPDHRAHKCEGCLRGREYPLFFSQRTKVVSFRSTFFFLFASKSNKVKTCIMKWEYF